MRRPISVVLASKKEPTERHIEERSSRWPSNIYSDGDRFLLRQMHIFPPGCREELDYIALHPRRA